jgi:hypothetical protein
MHSLPSRPQLRFNIGHALLVQKYNNTIGSIVPLGRDYFPDDSRHFVPLQFGHFETATQGEILDFSPGKRFFVFLLASEFRSV